MADESKTEATGEEAASGWETAMAEGGAENAQPPTDPLGRILTEGHSDDDTIPSDTDTEDATDDGSREQTEEAAGEESDGAGPAPRGEAEERALDYAERIGMNRERAEALLDAGMLDDVFDQIERAYDVGRQSRAEAEADDSGQRATAPQRQQQDDSTATGPAALEFSFDPETHDPDVVSAFNQVRDYARQLEQRHEQIEARFQQLEQVAEEQRRTAFEARVEAALNHVPDEYKDAIGKGLKPHQRSRDQREALGRVYEQAALLQRRYSRLGMRREIEDLLPEAVEKELAGTTKQIGRKQVSDALRDGRGRFVSPVSSRQRTSSAPSNGDKAAIDAVKSFMSG